MHVVHTVQDVYKRQAIPIGDLVSRRVGMVAVTVRTCVGDVKLNRVLNFEYYDETVMPDSGIGTTAERKQAAIRFMAENGLCLLYTSRCV